MGKVFGGTTDNGQNIVNAVRLLWLLPLCSPHATAGQKKSMECSEGSHRYCSLQKACRTFREINKRNL